MTEDDAMFRSVEIGFHAINQPTTKQSPRKSKCKAKAKKSSSAISFEEWAAELAKVASIQEEGVTTDELSLSTGMSRSWVLRQLKHGMRLGLVRCVTVSRKSLDGRPVRVPGYQFTKPKKARAKR